MSRLGKIPVQIPSGVEVKKDGHTLTVKGPKGTLSRDFRPVVDITVADGTITTAPQGDEAKALWGTYAAHLHNMINGVTKGFEKVLEVVGVGYRMAIEGNQLVLSVGFSHPVRLEIPAGVEAKVEKSVLTLSGPDKDVLGQFAANVRKVRPPEPYKGKGIRYQNEYIIRKQGKKAV